MLKRTKANGRTCVGDLRLSAIDVGFDLRTVGQTVQIPGWAFRSVGLDDRDGNRWLVEGPRGELIAEMQRLGYEVAPIKTIFVTWADGKLIARCDEDHTLNSNVVAWPEPITAATDPRDVANKVTEINGAEIVSIDHDRDTIMLHVDGSVLADQRGADGLTDDDVAALADDHEAARFEDDGEAAFGRED